MDGGHSKQRSEGELWSVVGQSPVRFREQKHFNG